MKIQTKLFKTLSVLLIISVTLCSLIGCNEESDNADGATKLSFKSALEYDYLKTLDGKQVTINGYMATSSPGDGSFMYLNPHIAVITNIEADHLDHYGTLENIEKAFCDFMSLVGPDGTIVACGERDHEVELAKSTGRAVVTYGFNPSCDYVCAEEPASGKLETRFSVTGKDGKKVFVTIHSNPGKHNILNATAAIAVAGCLGYDLEQAAAALSQFKGARRRFTYVGEVNGATIVDDYGHHPTEIAATLKAADGLGFKRVIVVFQPHRYTRTESLLDGFAHAFNDCDKLFVMDVFSAGEMPIPGVSGKSVAQAVSATGEVDDVRFIASRSKLIDELLDELGPDDLLITQGAGDVTLIGPALIAAAASRE